MKFQRSMFGLLGCYTILNCATVEQRHLDSWAGRPVVDLENHPLWGVPDQQVELSSGAIAYVYYSAEPTISHTITEDMAVLRSPVCKYTFIVTDKKVASMTVKGQCYTTDAQMPAVSKP